MHLWILSRVPRQPEPNTFASQIGSPDTLITTPTEFLIRPVFVSATRRFRQDDFQIAALRADPSLDERLRILGEIFVEYALSIGLMGFLHE